MARKVRNARSINVWEVNNLTNDLEDFDAYKHLLGGMAFRTVTINVLKGAAKEIKKETLSILRGVFPGAWKSNEKYNDSVYEAVRVGRTKASLHATETSVHILGTGEKGSQTYKLRFYEGLITRRTRFKGTPRVKGRSYKSTTDIGGMRFFEKARANVDTWATIRKGLDKYLKDHNWTV